MQVYKLDNPTRASASSQIKGMSVVLNEITPTLQQTVARTITVDKRPYLNPPAKDSVMPPLNCLLDMF